MALNREDNDTIVRLLERDTADFDGPNRHRAHTRNRRRVALLAVAVLLLLAVVLTPLLRQHHNHSSAVRPTPVASETTAASPHATQARQRTVAGVPVGYPDTRAGAEAAAANYAVAYGSAAMFRTQQRNAIVDAIADPNVTTALRAQLDQTFSAVLARFGLDADGNPPKGQTFVDRTLPAGVRLLSYTDTKAQVAVWTAGLVGLTGSGSTLPVAEAWNTATVTLHWVDGDWKWVAFTQTDGPTPISGMQAPSNADVIADAVRGFEGLPYAS